MNFIIAGSNDQFAMHKKINDEIDWWTNTVFIAMVYVTLPAIFMPKCCLSYVLYFTTDLGNDAFTPAVPML